MGLAFRFILRALKISAGMMCESGVVRTRGASELFKVCCGLRAHPHRPLVLQWFLHSLWLVHHLT